MSPEQLKLNKKADRILKNVVKSIFDYNKIVKTITYDNYSSKLDDDFLTISLINYSGKIPEYICKNFSILIFYDELILIKQI